MFFVLLIVTLFYFSYFKIIIAITLIRYLVKNFISCLDCLEVIFFSPFGESFCDFLKIANDLSVKLCDNAMQTLSISAYIRI